MRVRVFILTIAIASIVAVVAPAARPGGGDALAQSAGGLEFVVAARDDLALEPTAGRMFVIVSRDDDEEPRFQVDVAGGVPFWGMDVDRFGAGDNVVIAGDEALWGYPLQRIQDLPADDYYVQAFYASYETFERSDGSVVQLPLPCGDGQDLFRQPGNAYSEVERVTLDPATPAQVELVLDQVIEPADAVAPDGTCQQGNPADTTHVRHLKIQSERLTEYWGRPMYIAANVLLPVGYDDIANRTVRYPLVVRHGHYPSRAPFRFDEEGGNDFSQWWLSDQAPRMLVVEIRHENPYYDDSYAVNSRNLGPYGDAINHELMPAIEREFRTIGQPWARVLTGGSTGGWEAMATQLFYPDLYQGTFASCPDSLDFRRHQLINVYEDDNAYYTFYDWERVERPSAREVTGDIRWTMRQENHWELALGTNSRSTGQWDIWEAVFGPQAPDGYPARIWDKKTGEIDHSVAEQWKPYDLQLKITEEWADLGPRLAGQLHVYTGDDDTYFLNLSTALFEEAVAALDDPPADATFVYGDNEPHCWSPYTNEELVEVMADHIVGQAPSAAATKAWAAPRQQG